MEITRRIIETAKQLFVKHGVRTITMNDIAAEAGVSKKTLYEHFLNKEDLLGKTLDSMHEEGKAEREIIFENGRFNIDSMLEIIRLSALRINEINPNFITDIKKYHPRIWKDKLKKMENDTIQFKARLIKEGIKQGYFRSDINIDIASKLLHEQINILMDNEIFPSNSYSRTEVFQTIMNIFGRGVIKENFQKELNKINKHKSNDSTNIM